MLTDVVQAKQCLKILYGHLLPGGKLLFEVETIHAVPHDLGHHQQSTVHMRDDGEKIVLDTVSSYDAKTQIVKTICHYDLMRNDKIIQTEIENLEERYYREHEMDEWLIEAGFQMFSRYKAFDLVPPDAKDELIIYECVKTPS